MSAALVLPMVWARAESDYQANSSFDEEPAAAATPELTFYRRYTEGMLRRYVRLAMETGRVPSLIGQPMFRGRVTSYRVRSFEDVVIFVFDVEKCLKRLDERSQELIARITLQEYTQGETAGLTGMSLRSVVRHYADAIDKLTVIFLEMEMLEPQTEGDMRRRQAVKKRPLCERG